jgi:hypothetical protein
MKTTKTTTTIVEGASSGRPADNQPSVASSAVSAPASSDVTPLASRIFGTWNIAVGIVRLFASYHMHEPAWYQMQMITNIVGLVHFSLEAFVYKTAKPSGPWFAPTTVASIGLIWSLAQYSHYVR